ncbi:two-component sensor histidine kinase [Alicyclobacillus contaminans]|uniref:sensor histidine kinase n=1 Tax=Alicyclobacillus contaminans TaxID=392016 RepID=UPI0012EBF337|nr:HAMP domain-containing sensor histidine kinase [Alicyclobacillus contaminans]GMA48837.1 two-component sensor histidine kinase [Alicyclobacillus contaminans]
MQLRLFVTYMIVILVAVLGAGWFLHVYVSTHVNHWVPVVDMDRGRVVNSRALMLKAFDNALWGAGFIAAGLAFVLSLLLSRTISQPLRQMMGITRRIADGQFKERLYIARQDEFGELAKSLNRMAQRLESIESMRTQLMADVAHELSTPLTSIQGLMEGMLDGVFPMDAATLERVQQEVVRLRRLVHNLKDLSVLESHPHPFTSIQVNNLVEILSDTVRQVEPQFAEKGIELRYPDWDRTAPVNVLVDAERMTQVFLNLLSNAHRYTAEGGRVDIDLAVEEGQAVVRVRDTGIGIAQADLPRIFERFYRADPSRSRSTGGSGIGLSIVREIIERHGGTITVESELGVGSCFTVSLPMTYDDDAVTE